MAPVAPSKVSLERALSKLGLATRAEARALIAEGRVRVNGHTAREPSQPVVPERIHIQIDGRDITRPPRVTIALHKPRGVVTTRRDPQGRKTVYDLIVDVPYHVVPVGRLDYATSGLLLLTNDTQFANWLTDPGNQVPRIYLVTVRGRISQEEADALAAGVSSGGERLFAQGIVVRKASNRESHLIVELIEGRNREVRRLMAAIGLAVTRLRRVQFGGIVVDRLAPGAWRYLSDDELLVAFPRAGVLQKHLRARMRER